ncbi:MAG: class I SAM-dependent methyltransferase [Methyloprofundus sp.]|nr:class I SAM-dependent methyltransferase [Methyloprofundus sp.]
MKTEDQIKKRPGLDLNKYNTDKISNNYLDSYDPVLEPWVGKNINLLELGIHKGGSLLLWHDYFPSSKIVGIDLNPPENFRSDENIFMYKGNQADTRFLSSMANEIAPEGFDIIIDDASHIGELTKVAFWHLFEHHLKPGGLYVIEDWSTGYWDDWFDGKSLDFDTYRQPVKSYDPAIPMPGHNYGMVGFIKQLVDEQAAKDVTRQNYRGKTVRESKFKQIIINSSIVFIIKAG